jgi:hypothetical protein
MYLHLEQFTDDELGNIDHTYNAIAGQSDVDDLFRAWSREVAESLQVVLAGRLMAEAEADDPLAYCWFGRLPEPGTPGKWEGEP